MTDQVETDLKRAEDELYKVPEHLKVSGAGLVWLMSMLVFTIIILLSIISS